MFKYVLAAVAVLFSVSANAADVKVYQYDNNGAYFIGFDGPVEEGDLEKLKQAYSDARITYKFNLHLRSPGGLGSEMEKIAEWIQDHGNVTTIADGQCLSACAVIWVHGQTKYVKGDTQVGFHVSSMAMLPEAIEFLNNYKDSYGWAGIQQGFQDQYADNLKYYFELPVNSPYAFVAEIGMASGGYHFWYLTKDNQWIVGNVNWY